MHPHTKKRSICLLRPRNIEPCREFQVHPLRERRVSAATWKTAEVEIADVLRNADVRMSESDGGEFNTLQLGLIISFQYDV